jgi:predicted nucleic acid-binding protein
MDHKLSLEYRAVGLRPEHLKASNQTAARVLIVIGSLEAIAESVVVIVKPRPLSSDPNDDMILDLAINGRADAIVTQNKKHFDSAAKRFGIRVLSPAEFLKRLREKE